MVTAEKRTALLSGDDWCHACKALGIIFIIVTKLKSISIDAIARSRDDPVDNHVIDGTHGNMMVYLIRPTWMKQQ
jgi:hypothetical protein